MQTRDLEKLEAEVDQVHADLVGLVNPGPLRVRIAELIERVRLGERLRAMDVADRRRDTETLDRFVAQFPGWEWIRCGDGRIMARNGDRLSVLEVAPGATSARHYALVGSWEEGMPPDTLLSPRGS